MEVFQLSDRAKTVLESFKDLREMISAHLFNCNLSERRSLKRAIMQELNRTAAEITGSTVEDSLGQKLIEHSAYDQYQQPNDTLEAYYDFAAALPLEEDEILEALDSQAPLVLSPSVCNYSGNILLGLNTQANSYLENDHLEQPTLVSSEENFSLHDEDATSLTVFDASENEINVVTTYVGQFCLDVLPWLSLPNQYLNCAAGTFPTNCDYQTSSSNEELSSKDSQSSKSHDVEDSALLTRMPSATYQNEDRQPPAICTTSSLTALDELRRPAARRQRTVHSTTLTPGEIDKYFTQRLAGSANDKVDLLTRLFDATASHCSIVQLRNAVAQARTKTPDSREAQEGHIKGVMQALDSLETSSIGSCILRRYFLVRLLEIKLSAEDELRASKQSSRQIRLSKYDLTRIETLKHGGSCGPNVQTMGDVTKNISRQRIGKRAFNKLLHTIYPKSTKTTRSNDEEKEYLRTVAKLKSRLACARNWHRMACRFSRGILALIPSGGDYQISVDQVEKLRTSQFIVFLDALDEKRGSFLRSASKQIGDTVANILNHVDEDTRFNFEDFGEEHIRNKSPDSKELQALVDVVRNI